MKTDVTHGVFIAGFAGCYSLSASLQSISSHQVKPQKDNSDHLDAIYNNVDDESLNISWSIVVPEYCTSISNVVRMFMSLGIYLGVRWHYRQPKHCTHSIHVLKFLTRTLTWRQDWMQWPVWSSVDNGWEIVLFWRNHLRTPATFPDMIARLRTATAPKPCIQLR